MSTVASIEELPILLFDFFKAPVKARTIFRTPFSYLVMVPTADAQRLVDGIDTMSAFNVALERANYGGTFEHNGQMYRIWGANAKKP